MMSLNSMS